MYSIIFSAKSPCGSTTITPLPDRMSSIIMFSKIVDLPIPVLPIKYICRRRSSSLMPNFLNWLRKLVSANTVMSWGIFYTTGKLAGGSALSFTPEPAPVSAKLKISPLVLGPLSASSLAVLSMLNGKPAGASDFRPGAF